MPKRWTPTPESFQTLLEWLDPDLERAAEKYEHIRHTLIKIFIWGGLNDAEGLADETINRVTEKVPEIRDDYIGDPALYFYGVARRSMGEHKRKARRLVPLTEEVPLPPLPANEPEDEPDSAEQLSQCLDKCMSQLSPKERHLISRYYDVKQPKNDHRQRLAEELGLALNNLRVRVYRIRASLHRCIAECIRQHDRNS